MKKWLVGLVIAAVAVMTFGTAIQAAAGAPVITYPDGTQVAGTRFIADCPVNKFCIRPNTSFGQPSYYWTITIRGCYVIGAPHDNTANSVHNNNPNRSVTVYMNPGGGGACTSTIIVFLPGQSMGQCNNAAPPIGTLHIWNTAGSPCSQPTASSFYVN